MYSKLRFYRVDFNTYTEENSYIDQLEIYLNTLEHYDVDNFQYIRNDLDISIKINKTQEQTNNFLFNYCVIENRRSASSIVDKFYYFIKKVSQIAPETLQLDLHMDTVNSLIDPRQFNSDTEIIREHIDRFKKPLVWRPTVGGVLNRKIDKESEGIVTEKYKSYETKLYGSNDNYNWYLIYKNRNEIDPQNPDSPNPVEISLCADTAIYVGTPSRGESITYNTNDFTLGNYYYFLDVDNPNGEFTINSQARTLGDNINKCQTIGTNAGVSVVGTVDQKKLRGLIIYKDTASSLKYACIYDDIHYILDNNQAIPSLYSNNIAATVGESITNLGTKWSTLTSVTFTQANFFRVATTDYTLENLQPEGIKSLIRRQSGIYIGSHTTNMLSTIDDIDRTDSKLIKIIKYPYCPITYTVNSTIFDFGDDWIYDLGLMVYNKENLPDFGSICTTFTLPELTVELESSDIGYTKSKNKDLESKLYNSDFYTTKLVYDSFSKEYKLENIIKKNGFDASLLPVNVEFKPTNTINSKFGFIPDWMEAYGGNYEEEADFDKVLLTTRNNEETILNNAYLNYIKNGYNYDKKANSLQIEQAQRNASASTIGSLLSIIGSIASFAAAPATGGASTIAGISLATSAVAGGINSANQWMNISTAQQNQENAMQSKLAQLAAQSASTSGTDDVDLMSWYSGNKLWLMHYRTKEKMENKIYKTLDHTGYAHSVIEAPDVDSRIWYNYIQCIPHIPYELSNKLKESWLDDLKKRYQQGVTVYHYNHDHGDYDFNREYENYENWIVEGV